MWRGLDHHHTTTYRNRSVNLYYTFYTAVSDPADFIVIVLEKFSLGLYLPSFIHSEKQMKLFKILTQFNLKEKLQE